MKCNRMLRSNHGVSGIIQPLETMQHGGTPVVRKLLDLQQTKICLGFFCTGFCSSDGSVRIPVMRCWSHFANG